MEIFHDVPMQEYRDWEELSQSQVKKAWQSIRHFTTPFGSETQSMKIGSIFHQMILEPHLDDYWIVGPAFKKNTKVYKEWLADQKEGITIITEAEHYDLQAMKDSVMSSRKARMILDAIQDVEVSARGAIESLPFNMKARADGLTKPAVVDLKTTVNASKESFSKSIDMFRYDVQGSCYSQAFDKEGMVFICVENKAPFNCAVYELDQDAMETGAYILDICCRRIEQYLQDGIASSYQNELDNEIETIGLPGWAKKKIYD